LSETGKDADLTVRSRPQRRSCTRS